MTKSGDMIPGREYIVGFWAHGEYHEIAIDLECLTRALKLNPSAEEEGR